MAQHLIPALPPTATVVERIARFRDLEAIERAGLATHSPTVTEADTERISRLIDAGMSDSTRSAYTSAHGAYTAFLTTHGHSVEDAYNPLLVTAYLTGLHEGGASPSTIEVHRAAILHHAGGQAETLRSHEGLRRALKGIRREGRRQWTKTQARALTAPEVRSMAAACSPHTLRGMRDRALLLVGLALGVRASNLALLTAADLVEHERGYEVTVRFSKTSDTPEVLALPRLAEGSLLCPVTALETYLGALQRTGEYPAADAPDRASYPVFRAIRRGGNTLAERRHLTVEAITGIVKAMAETAGVSPEGLSSHSIRATFATLALACGVAESAVMAGRWSSLQVMRGYDRSTRWADGRVAGTYLGAL